MLTESFIRVISRLLPALLHGNWFQSLGKESCFACDDEREEEEEKAGRVWVEAGMKEEEEREDVFIIMGMTSVEIRAMLFGGSILWRGEEGNVWERGDGRSERDVQ